jgi:hypothetical protein
MSQTACRDHDCQRVLWDQVVKAYGYPKGYENKNVDDIFGRPFEHVIPLNHALEALSKRDDRAGGRTVAMNADYDYDRTRFELVSGAYVPIQSKDASLRLRVEVSNLVYSENTAFVSTPKKAGEETESGKTAIKFEPNIPVVFVHGTQTWTRHYQPDRPMHLYAGMTNRLFETLPTDIMNFLIDGTLPPEIKK